MIFPHPSKLKSSEFHYEREIKQVTVGKEGKTIGDKTMLHGATFLHQILQQKTIY